jgi:hypothetical protein
MYIPEQYWCMNRYLQGLKKFSETCFPASILNGYTELWQMPSLQPLNAAGIVGRMKYHQDLIQDLSERFQLHSYGLHPCRIRVGPGLACRHIHQHF